VKILVLGGTSSIAEDFLRIASANRAWEIHATFCKNRPRKNLEQVKWTNFCLEAGLEDIKSSLGEFNFNYIINFIVLDLNTSLEKHYNILANLVTNLLRNNTRFINVSSNAVYVESFILINEDSKLDINSHYSNQKILSENILSGQQLNLRAAILPTTDFGSGSLVKNIYNAQVNSKIIVNPKNKWNGILSINFAEILYAIINKNLYVSGERNIFSLNPEPTSRLMKAIQVFTGRKDLIVELNSDVPINSRILNTKYSEFHIELWRNSRFGTEITTSRVLAELAKLQFHRP
jgi:hypothetical protein